MTKSTAKKGVGIIGYGGFGEFIKQAWSSMDSVQVVAVCDSDPTRAPVDARFYQQVGPLFADSDVDIISIATPPNSHKDLAIMAMESGKHVLVEKPLALNERDAVAVKECADYNKRIASVDFMMRFNPIADALKKITQTEVLGKLRRIDLRNYAMLDKVPEDHWFWNPDISGRIFLEHGVHFFDLAHMITGAKAASAWSIVADRKPGIEDRVFAGIKYDNDVIGTFWHSFTRPRVLERTSFHFSYDLGEIDTFGWIPMELKIWGLTDKNGIAVIQSLDNLKEIRADKMEQVKTQSGEFFYDVEYDFEVLLKLDKTKSDVYSDNLRSIMDDIVKAIDDPTHKLRATLDDAIEAVRTAEMATNFSHPNLEIEEKMDAGVLRP